MNEAYSEYINSDAWRKKRWQRLAMSGFRCAACGSNKHLEVHHLTYERIFNENMDDLLPLCFLHHETAEDLVARGEIPRVGDVKFLQRETLRLIVPSKKKKEKPGKINGVKCRNRCQSDLMSEPWFLDALMLSRGSFKQLVREKFVGHTYRNSVLSNAFTLYDRSGCFRNARRKSMNKSKATS